MNFPLGNDSNAVFAGGRGLRNKEGKKGKNKDDTLILIVELMAFHSAVSEKENTVVIKDG